MTMPRLLPALVLAALAGLAQPAFAGSDHRGGPPISSPGLPLDPELLPPNSAPGDCVVRRVTGPGGAYRWERIECENQQSWGGRDQWGYGDRRLEIETRDSRPHLLGGCNCDRRGHGDRYAYGDRRQGQAYYERQVDEYEHETSRAYDSGYLQSGGYAYGDGYAYGGRREDRYGPMPSSYVDYGYGGAAGRDQDGYLVWPGKLP